PTVKGNLSKQILMRNYIGTTSSVLMKKDIFEEVGGFDIEMPALQDYDLWVRVCQLTNIGYISEPLIKYYFHNQNGQISDNLDIIEKAACIFDSKHRDLLLALGEVNLNERNMIRDNSFGKRLMRMNKN